MTNHKHTSSDLVERLRRIQYAAFELSIGDEAADRIEALEAENMMLREERDRLIKFFNIMCEEYGLEYGGVVKQ